MYIYPLLFNIILYTNNPFEYTVYIGLIMNLTHIMLH